MFNNSSDNTTPDYTNFSTITNNTIQGSQNVNGIEHHLLQAASN
jgi:hypothetical protein